MDDKEKFIFENKILGNVTLKNAGHVLGHRGKMRFSVGRKIASIVGVAAVVLISTGILAVNQNARIKNAWDDYQARMSVRQHLLSEIKLAIFSALMLYVVISVTNLLLKDSFISNNRLPEGLYFTFLIFHFAISAFTVLFGGLTLSKRGIIPSGRYRSSCRHRVVFVEMGLLILCMFTGLFIYYLTFIY